MSESDLVRSIRDYLTILEKQGTICWFERLNSGKILQSVDNRSGGITKYMVNLCRPGTPDFIVVSLTELLDYPEGEGNTFVPTINFLECKTAKGKLTPEQKEFQIACEGWAKYHVIRDVEEVIKLYASD